MTLAYSHYRYQTTELITFNLHVVQFSLCRKEFGIKDADFNNVHTPYLIQICGNTTRHVTDS
jgi:hypothetical protein